MDTSKRFIFKQTPAAFHYVREGKFYQIRNLSNPPKSIPELNLKKRIGKSGEVSYTSLVYGKEGEFKRMVVHRGCSAC